MIPHLFFSQLVILGLLWLFVMRSYAWPSPGVTTRTKPATPILPHRQRSNEPKPFAGLTHKPHCAACAYDAPRPQAPSPVPSEPMPATNRRPRQVDTSTHFCPHPGCDYRGGVGLGNLRANGHPNGGPWRQLHCTSCGGYVLETHGTIFHGTRVPVDLIVHVLACVAEGLGIRGTARVFEVDPNTACHGSWRPRSSCGLFHPPSWAMSTSDSANWTHCLPCSVRSRPAKSRRP